ncbi:hypothetical protein ACJZ2D_004407 [Fusarium nematophilum]
MTRLAEDSLPSSHSQFQSFFPTFDSWYRGGIAASCEEQNAAYVNTSLPDPPNSGHQIAWGLVNCILDELQEVAKAEMAISGILLGLLPAALAQIGPSQAEIAFLSIRRPFLSLLLYVGTPAPNPSHGNVYAAPVEFLRSPEPMAFLSGLPHAPSVGLVALSLLEYAAASAAAANCAYQTYRLTYQAVSLAPITVLLRGLTETAVLFGWIILLVPIHFVNMAVFRLRYRELPPRRSWASAIADELRPCCSGSAVFLEERKTSLLQVLLSFLLTVAACLHVMAGTVLLGSVLFITVADVLVLVESFVGAALLSRAILMFELQGMVVARPDTLPNRPALLDTRGAEKDEESVNIRERRALMADNER